MRARRRPPASRLDRVEAWLALRRRSVVIALVVASAALRAVYFIQLNAGPCIELQRWQQTDMHYYDQWGRAIANGDWLSRSVGVPMHQWHKDVAAQYAASHRGTDATAEAVWAAWNGPHRFYQDPLYAYVIGFTYRVVTADPRVVLIGQLALGILSNVLIYLLARRYFGEIAGAMAAGMALACGPLLYYELLLLRDSIIVCAGLAIVWLSDRAIDRGTWRWFLALGAALGLAALLKSTFILLGVLLAIGVIVQRGRRALVPLAALAGGVALAIAPAAVRNITLGVPPLAWAGSGALTFASGNSPSYPRTGGFYINTAEIAAIMGSTDGRFLPVVRATLALHSPGSLAALIAGKASSTVNWYEVPNNVNFYYMRIRAPILAWLPLTFYGIAPLGLVGLVLAASRFRAAWPLYLLVASTLLSLVVFVVLGRLRVPLVAALIPFAAFTVERALRLPAMAKAMVVAAVLVTGAWTGRPLPAGMPLISLTDWLTPFLSTYQYDVKAAMDGRDPLRAALVYREFLRYEPDFSRMPASGGTLDEAADREVATTFARVHAVCAQLFAETGRPADARADQERAAQLTRLGGA